MAQQDWFVVRDGKETGPFSGQQLKSMAASGKLQPDDKVRRGDMKTASKVSSIKGLFAPVTPAAAQPPPPPSSTEAAPSSSPDTQKKIVPSKKTLIIASAVAGACLLLCCGGIGVIGTLATKNKDAANKKVEEGQTADKTGTGASSPRPGQKNLVAEFEALALVTVPEFSGEEFKYDYTKDDYASTPAEAKRETRKRVIKGGAEGLAGKPETMEGYVNSSGKFIEHGTFTTWTDYTDSKKLREGKMLHGKMHGVMVFYYPNGKKLWERPFVQDKQHGVARSWHENGRLTSEVGWIKGKFHGRRQLWFDTGAPESDQTWVHGDLHGLSKGWWKDGSLAWVGWFNKGKRVGKYLSWNEDGSEGERGEWDGDRPKGKCRLAFVGSDKRWYFIEADDGPWKGGTIAEFIARMYYFSKQDRPDIGLQFDPKLKIANYYSKGEDEFFTRFGKPSGDVVDFEKAPVGAPASIRDRYRIWSYGCRDGVLMLHTQPTQTGSLLVTAHVNNLAGSG
jgi:antitoxin component YwqK of YwqJK toxin-antitoxin module